jgi:hypothetical protein
MMKESAAELRAVRCKRFKQSTHFRYQGLLLDGLRLSNRRDFGEDLYRSTVFCV